MANWAYTCYAIEGPKDTLQKIHQAILNPTLEEGEGKDWEGGVLRALNIDWELRTIISERTEGDKTYIKTSGYYMRGFIQKDTVELDEDVLCFSAEEAWGATDFRRVLENNIPDIKVFFSVEETGEDIFATNDKEGKYFPDRYWADTTQDDEYQSEYFQTEEAMYNWLSEITNGRVKCAKDVETFNSDYEDSGTDDENFIYIHEFEIVD